eukprot:gene12171-15289_t
MTPTSTQPNTRAHASADGAPSTPERTMASTFTRASTNGSPPTRNLTPISTCASTDGVLAPTLGGGVPDHTKHSSADGALGHTTRTMTPTTSSKTKASAMLPTPPSTSPMGAHSPTRKSTSQPAPASAARAYLLNQPPSTPPHARPSQKQQPSTLLGGGHGRNGVSGANGGGGGVKEGGGKQGDNESARWYEGHGALHQLSRMSHTDSALTPHKIAQLRLEARHEREAGLHWRERVFLARRRLYLAWMSVLREKRRDYVEPFSIEVLPLFLSNALGVDTQRLGERLAETTSLVQLTPAAYAKLRVLKVGRKWLAKTKAHNHRHLLEQGSGKEAKEVFLTSLGQADCARVGQEGGKGLQAEASTVQSDLMDIGRILQSEVILNNANSMWVVSHRHQVRSPTVVGSAQTLMEHGFDMSKYKEDLLHSMDEGAIAVQMMYMGEKQLPVGERLSGLTLLDRRIIQTLIDVDKLSEGAESTFVVNYNKSLEYIPAGTGYAMLALGWPSEAFNVNVAGNRDYIPGSLLQWLQDQKVQYLYNTKMVDAQNLTDAFPAVDPSFVAPALYAMEAKGAGMAMQAMEAKGAGMAMQVLISPDDHMARQLGSLVVGLDGIDPKHPYSCNIAAPEYFFDLSHLREIMTAPHNCGTILEVHAPAAYASLDMAALTRNPIARCVAVAARATKFKGVDLHSQIIGKDWLRDFGMQLMVEDNHPAFAKAAAALSSHAAPMRMVLNDVKDDFHKGSRFLLFIKDNHASRLAFRLVRALMLLPADQVTLVCIVGEGGTLESGQAVLQTFRDSSQEYKIRRRAVWQVKGS